MKNNEKFISMPNIVLIMAFPLLASIVVFYYNKTLAEHNSTIARLKAAKNWIYEE